MKVLPKEFYSVSTTKILPKMRIVTDTNPILIELLKIKTKEHLYCNCSSRIFPTNRLINEK